MKAVGVAWEGASGPAEVARIRGYCATQGWELAACQLWAGGLPALGPLMARVAETGAARVLLTQEVLTELEQGYPHLWAAVQARCVRLGVFAVAV